MVWQSHKPSNEPTDISKQLGGIYDEAKKLCLATKVAYEYGHSRFTVSYKLNHHGPRDAQKPSTEGFSTFTSYARQQQKEECL